MASGFPMQGCQPWYRCLEPPNLSDIDDTDEEVDTEFWSLLNPQCDESKGDWGGATHNSHCPWPQSQPHCGAPDLIPGVLVGGPVMGTSHHSAAAGRFAGHGNES